MKTITIEVPDDCDVQIVRKEENKEPVIRDKELREYSIKNNYKLIEISYKLDIEEILNKQLVKDYLMVD